MAGKPHLGLILPNYGQALSPDRLAEAALAAEAAGFDSGWVTDHVLVPAEHASVYGTITEALVSLGYLAGRTTTLWLGVSALIVPQRNPYVVLKQLASLDLLSGGRILTAVAAGWMEGEFRTLGASFERRGRRLDDWLDLAGSAFGQAPGAVEYAGRLPLEDAWLSPGFVRREGIELWVAGVSEHTVRRAARTGVWHPVALPPAELQPLAASFRERCPDGRVVLRLGVAFATEPDRAGVDERGRFGLAGPPEWLADGLAQELAAGCDGFVVNLGHEQQGLGERVQRFAEQVWPLVGRQA